MFDPSETLPYIGLRPFSEDDSLYFKGRDEQILQLTALLEANKFLMVTGASGDGKSSLVYAGLVPNARAGFFKATYTNWVVADFRPERSPLLNLSKSISRNLRIGNEESVEIELRRGFSSLIELYTSSSLYVDEQGDVWKNANEEEREDLHRKSANLLIVADQFEEFFTNPENYYKNAPSADSQLVINLLLETARIAISKNLPVYIVCTMRSDYIGQCAAFRGLPEFIGFSQFFVPRLKRKEMVQVVKEPALLHGDKISNRLVERVVYDLGEGIDQLPVLEHALNEVWIQAKHGYEELDLLHYAMAGGMSSKELPIEDRKSFEDWFSVLPQNFQEAYQRPGLSQIIDTHANKLYLSAADHYNQRHTQRLSTQDVELIIKVAFICLTKMDEDRAVRNRMTLQEITDIIARPNLTCEIVGGVLNIFREEGNTFLRPYITDDPETQSLKPESVLDITHESLIRNWALLLRWAQEEYDHLTVYEDFKKQLDRWVESGKANGFLLPIGPLTFFEDWHDTLSPNKFWINRYLDPGIEKKTRLLQAQQIIDDTRDFLDRSAKKVRITRLVVKYGASRIATVIGSILILTLCGFYYQDAQKKKNENVVKRILSEGQAFMSDPRFDRLNRADFLIMSEFMEPGSFRKQMDKVPGDQQMDLINGTYTNFMFGGANPGLRSECLLYGDSLVHAVPIQKNDPAFLTERLKALNTLVMTTSHHLYYFQDERLEEVRENALLQTKEILPLVFNQDFELDMLSVPAINDGIENVLNHNTINKDEAEQLLALISPFESSDAKQNFASYYPANKQVLYANRQDQLKHNGGYQELAYLYGYLGRVETVKACVDSLIKDHPNYSNFINNIQNIATYLIKGGYTKEADGLLDYYSQKQKVSKKELYELWLNTSGFMDRHMFRKIRFPYNYNANLEFLGVNDVTKLFAQYYNVILAEYKNPDALNFNLALYFKHQAIILSKIDADNKYSLEYNPDSLFAKSITFYQKVSKAYLQEEEEVYYGGQVGKKIRRKDIFLYPDHLQKVQNNRLTPPLYFSDTFIQYLIKSKAFNKLYQEPQDVDQINNWIVAYNLFHHPAANTRVNRNFTLIETAMLEKLDSLLTDNPLALNLNCNFIRLVLIDNYLTNNEYDKIESVYKKIQIERIPENFKGSSRNDQQVLAYKIERLTEYLASKGKKEEVFRIIASYTNRINRIKAYATAPIELIRNATGPKEDVYLYLDSALTEFSRVNDFLFFSEDPRIAMALTSALVGGKEMNALARQFASKISIREQSGATQILILGTALNGDYHLAYTSIPEIALIDKLFYFNLILSTEGAIRMDDSEWETYFLAFRNNTIWDVLSYDIEFF